MRDLSYPPCSFKVGTGGQYGVGVNTQERPPQPREAMHLLTKAESLGDEKAQQWIDTNCPDKPDWLKALRQSPENDAQK